MALEIKQSLRLSQQLVMTPQLQQAIKLLQLNRLELVDVVNQELMENPLLEEQADPTGPEAEGQEASGDESGETGNEAGEGTGEASSDVGDHAPLPGDPIVDAKSDTQAQTKDDEFDWDNYIEQLNNNSKLPSVRLNNEELPSFENILTKTTTLSEHLLWQVGLTQFIAEEKRLAELVIGNLSDEGYLIAPLEDIAREVGMEVEDAVEVLKMIQRFDPIGVGSRDLRECLLVQAQMLRPRNALVEEIVGKHLPDLERKNYQAITRGLGVPMEDVITAIKVILEFEPKPGRSFVAIDNTQYITPDIYVVKVGDDFSIVLNEDGMPRLRISNYYKSALASASKESGATGGKSTTKEYLHEKLRSAVWLIRSIHNRQKTIYKVTESIVRRQKEFFIKGVGSLRPMILKDVAQDIGMHESTVSRVTTNKFVHTPVGIFELKYFFNSGISTTDGMADVASEAVKDKIKGMISKEDARKPLSDQRIAELLKAENIDIARRTVAKYREMLGILSSSKRKQVF